MTGHIFSPPRLYEVSNQCRKDTMLECCKLKGWDAICDCRLCLKTQRWAGEEFGRACQRIDDGQLLLIEQKFLLQDGHGK